MIPQDRGITSQNQKPGTPCSGKGKEGIIMTVNCDLYYDKQDIIDTIDRLARLAEEIDQVTIMNTDVIQEAINILYEIIE